MIFTAELTMHVQSTIFILHSRLKYQVRYNVFVVFNSILPMGTAFRSIS